MTNSRRARSKTFPWVICFTLVFGGARDIASASDWYRTSAAQATQEIIMLSKTLIAALIVASAAVSFTTKASAGPGAQSGHESFYQYRASQNHDNGGN
jgi:hypothetical protein